MLYLLVCAFDILLFCACVGNSVEWYEKSSFIPERRSSEWTLELWTQKARKIHWLQMTRVQERWTICFRHPMSRILRSHYMTTSMYFWCLLKWWLGEKNRNKELQFCDAFEKRVFWLTMSNFDMWDFLLQVDVCYSLSECYGYLGQLGIWNYIEYAYLKTLWFGNFCM